MSDIKAAYLFASAIGSIKFDTTIDEQHTTSLAVASYPVEKGAPIIDHTYPEPKKLVLNIAHGLTPLNAQNEQGNSLRITDLHDALLAAQQSGELLEVITAIYPYENMVITQLVAIRNKQNTSVLALTVTLLEVIQIPLSAINDFNVRYTDAAFIDARANSIVNRDSISTNAVKDGSIESNRNISILKNIKDGAVQKLGGLF